MFNYITATASLELESSFQQLCETELSFHGWHNFSAFSYFLLKADKKFPRFTNNFVFIISCKPVHFYNPMS
jgi:hypothetical protein